MDTTRPLNALTYQDISYFDEFIKKHVTLQDITLDLV
jgi:hypothetical protein